MSAATALRKSGLAAVALLLALASVAASRAAPLPGSAAPGPEAGGDLVWRPLAAIVTADLIAVSQLDDAELGGGGLTRTGPVGVADCAGGAGGLSGPSAAWDPAPLTSGAALQLAFDDILRTLPDLGIIPGNASSLFDRDLAVGEPIYCAFAGPAGGRLAPGEKEEALLRSALAASTGAAGIAGTMRVVPEPTPALLVSQGIIAIALFGSRRRRTRCAASAGG